MFNVCLPVKRYAGSSTDASEGFVRSDSPMAMRTATWSLINGHRITKGDGRSKGSGGSPPG